MIVAIDSATDRLSVAVGVAAGPVATRAAEGARRHTGLLGDFVAAALGELGAGWGDVRGLALADGPGSFTGLRVSAAWAKAVARARGLPVYAASTLLVRAAAGAVPGERVVGVGEAMRGELFAAGYHFLADLTVEEWAAPRVVRTVAEIGSADRIARGWPEAARLIDLVGRPGGARRLEDLGGWEPDYGRLAEAQVKWEQAHGRPLADSTGDAR
jgi:tRNA threonylcarbamoyladenosine biosynthesis protein TsaB